MPEKAKTPDEVKEEAKEPAPMEPRKVGEKPVAPRERARSLAGKSRRSV